MTHLPHRQYPNQSESERDPFEDLCAIWFDDPDKGIIAMIVAYFDASYNQPPEDKPKPLVHTVGGYVGPVDDWRKFRREWRLELDKKQVDDFHMNKFEHARSRAIATGEIPKSSQYHGWSVDDFVPFQTRLHQILTRKRKSGAYRMAGFVNSLTREDFKKTVPSDWVKTEPGCQSPYIFNVAVLMESIAQWLNGAGYGGRIHYVFAGGDGEGGNLERWFDYLYKNKLARDHYRLSKGYSRIGYSIEWAQEEPALQAADVITFEFNKAAESSAELGRPLDLEDMRKSLPTLCKNLYRASLMMEPNLINSWDRMRAFKDKNGFICRQEDFRN